MAIALHRYLEMGVGSGEQEFYKQVGSLCVVLMLSIFDSLVYEI